MAIGYQYRICKNFPEINERGKTVTLDPQLVLIGDHYRPAHSSITFDRTLTNGFKKYLIIHETERRMRVRFEESILESVIQQLIFSLFLSPNSEYVFVSAKDTICDELFRRVEIMYHDFEFSERRISLARMQSEDASQISGGWFKNLRAVDISAAALFGEEVTGSKEWERYTQQGSISILYLNYLSGKAAYKVSVSKIGGVVLYNNLQEDIQIELVDAISEQIKPYVIADDNNEDEN